MPQTDSFLSVEQENLVVSVVKKAEDNDDLIIRCYETAGTATTGVIHLPRFNRTIAAEFGPCEIKTFRVPKDPGAPVAKVNGETITQGEFDRYWKSFLRQRGMPAGHDDASSPEMGDMKKEVIDVLAPPSMDGNQSVPPEQLREGRFAGFVRKVIWQGGLLFETGEEDEAAVTPVGIGEAR